MTETAFLMALDVDDTHFLDFLIDDRRIKVLIGLF
jgi:hypothetical protein